MVITHARIALADCFRFREVLYNLLSQDLKIKYKRTFLGYFWSVLNPTLQLAVLSAVFSQVMRLGMKNYALFLFSGNLAWTFLSGSMVTASSALLENENFIKKIYLPKMLFPLSKVCLRLIDFMFALVALGLLMAILGYPFRPTIALVPFAIVILFAFSLGISLLMSVLTVYFRDTQYLLGVFLQLMYFLTPIIYPITSFPERYRPYLQLNPFYPPLHLFQKLIYYGQIPSGPEWASAISLALTSLLAGLGILLTFDEDLVFRM